MENKKSSSKNWPFTDNNQVCGMKLPEYLKWATGNETYEKELLLPAIQRGFVWKPKQIVDLWDSLLRGMPIGSLMLSKLSEGQVASTLTIKEKKTENISSEAMGLLDGQQRTLAMLIGCPFINSTQLQHCLWIDLAEEGYAGSPFDIRLTTKTQPFGFQRPSHSRLSRSDRKKAREIYDELTSGEEKEKPDYELFDLKTEHSPPRPWRAGSESNHFVKVKDLWEAFIKTANDEQAFLDLFKSHFADNKKLSNLDGRFSNLHKAFKHLEMLEVPLILIPEHISSPEAATPNDTPNPLVLLFERIGRNGASLSAEDLLFSMIKQKWPEAQELVNGIHDKISVRAFMSATDYVMSAFRLAAAQKNNDNDPGAQIADNPRPNPNDFHRHLDRLLGKKGESGKPLRDYLEESNSLTSAFESLYKLLCYQGEQDIGLPLPMMPHLSRGLIQVLLRWIMLNPAQNTIEDNRQKIVSFSLFWYLNVWDEHNASKKAFEIINSSDLGAFPAINLYEKLIDAQDDQFGLALPLMSYEALENILKQDTSASLRSRDEIFQSQSDSSTNKQKELYKRFCWGRKPILLWLQRAYVHQKFNEKSQNEFAGLTDEDTVPYDFDHLCPQNHWGADWRNIIRTFDEKSEVMKKFHAGRHDVGNCIGNLHVLESSLNRSFGDVALTSKLNSGMYYADSLLYHYPEHEKEWKTASPNVDVNIDGNEDRTWNEARLQAFQSAVHRRARGLYFQYYEACKSIMPK
ncbi:GmrSD restriction endonuclease domain-containing protein [Candidatus Nitrotoga sp. AM1P]|uniref:GmrSD restriction endonuclease domain-containing protein n=1 Tax=Candidatus Nitrotoga sp. AM1P TaxID=2559597 RepID=UPI0010AF8451|nr:DUF262 domain-containing protein [Candidatus Nitrotoga sp. AM1P]BBJ24657.1 hypothetical protein W01_25840 [Candidatus Nitrotoga sp. AM1P]